MGGVRARVRGVSVHYAVEHSDYAVVHRGTGENPRKAF